MRVVAGPICAVVAALMAAGCGRNRYDPWLVPEEQFAATVRTIALVSTEMPQDLEDPDPAQATFDSLLAAELRAAGFIVVTPAVTREIWGRLVDSVGGYYDPLLQFMQCTVDEGFLSPAQLSMIDVDDDASRLLDTLAAKLAVPRGGEDLSRI